LTQEAEKQLRKYASDEKILASIGNTRLLAIIYRGWQPEVLCEFAVSDLFNIDRRMGTE